MISSALIILFVLINRSHDRRVTGSLGFLPACRIAPSIWKAANTREQILVAEHTREGSKGFWQRRSTIRVIYLKEKHWNHDNTFSLIPCSIVLIQQFEMPSPPTHASEGHLLQTFPAHKLPVQKWPFKGLTALHVRVGEGGKKVTFKEQTSPLPGTIFMKWSINYLVLFLSASSLITVLHSLWFYWFLIPVSLSSLAGWGAAAVLCHHANPPPPAQRQQAAQPQARCAQGFCCLSCPSALPEALGAMPRPGDRPSARLQALRKSHS